MSFSFYVGIVIVSNIIGAFASLPASQTDRLGRSNVVIYGLLIVGTAGGGRRSQRPPPSGRFAIVICAIGLVEGAILVATPALVRDFSPQLGRASAMGFWTIGPVAGSLITQHRGQPHAESLRRLAEPVHHLGHHRHRHLRRLAVLPEGPVVQDPRPTHGVGPRPGAGRGQGPRASASRGGGGDQAAVAADPQVGPRRARPFGIAVFLLVYYVAAAFFTIYYSVTFKNPDGINFTVTQANGLNTWFWAADIVALIVVGVLSDRAQGPQAVHAGRRVRSAWSC